MKLIERLLSNYDHSSFIIKNKALFLLYLNLTLLLIIPILIGYTVYLQLHNPVLHYSINPPVIAVEIAIFFIIAGTTALLVRGRFFLSAHLTILMLFSAIWTGMFMDRSDIISRIDSIVMILAILAALPIFISRQKYMVLIYSALNFGTLIFFVYYFSDDLKFHSGSDYLADNALSFIFITIAAYNILSINNRALSQAETSNRSLAKSNEELTAANEELEAQNEELMRSEEALRFSEAELLAIFNSAHDAMIIFDLEGNIIDVNDQMLEMYDVDRERVLSLNVHDLSAPILDGTIIDEGIQRVPSGNKFLYEWKARRQRDGALFDVEAGVRRLRRRGKDVILAVVRDISDRKKAEETLRESLNEKIMLIKEIHHRVKNNMQVISSLLNMQADTMKNSPASQALRDAVGRIHSMASIHERVYSSDSFSRVDMSAYIEELSRDLMELYSGMSAITVNTRMGPVFIGLDRAIPFGLLINEILTNAIKHGGRGPEPCSIETGIQESDGWITMMIGDNGPGMDPELFESERKTSMGMQIIGALAGQIEAIVTLDVDSGTRFTIRIPSDR